MNQNINKLIESINKLSTDNLNKLSEMIEEMGEPSERFGKERMNGRLYRKLYKHYSIPEVNGGFKNIPKSNFDVERHAMVVLGKTTLTAGEINACRDIYTEFKGD